MGTLQTPISPPSQGAAREEDQADHHQKGQVQDAGALFVLKSRGSWVHCGYHLMTTSIVAPALLSLPYAFTFLGWIGGITCLVIGALVTFYTYNLISMVLERHAELGHRHRRFRDMAHDVLALTKWTYHENPTTTPSQKLIPFSIFFITLFIFLLKTKFVQVFHKKTSVPHHLPPGPHPWPIVGSVPEMWKNRPAPRWIHRVMKELNTEIACFRLGKTNVVAVSSPEIAREFLKKNDAVFASRPITITSGIFSHGFLGTIATPWGEQWRKMKRVLISDVFNQSNTCWLLKKRNEEADNLVKFIYNQCSINNGGSPSSLGQVVNVRTAAQHYTGNLIRKMMFGKRYFGKGREDGGPGDEEEEHVSALFCILSYVYAFSVSDYLPWLRIFDLGGHERKVSDAMEIVKKYQDGIVNERIQQWREGRKMEAEDLLDVFISLKDENGDPLLSAEEIKAQITEILLATVDNPSNAAEWGLSEMLNRPQQLQKAVEELDRVVGKDRLVEEHDIPNLHYINACAREALRLHPVVPFNVPHVSVSDCVVAGYFIPKGSSVLLSRLGLGRNPRVWEDPMRFDPERHLKEGEFGNQQAVGLAEPELRFITFTVGRRGCIGGRLGSTITVMLFARLLQGFTWSMPAGVEKIDLTEANSLLLKAMPLYAHAKPRLSPTVYPAN